MAKHCFYGGLELENNKILVARNIIDADGNVAPFTLQQTINTLDKIKNDTYQFNKNSSGSSIAYDTIQSSVKKALSFSYNFESGSAGSAIILSSSVNIFLDYNYGEPKKSVLTIMNHNNKVTYLTLYPAGIISASGTSETKINLSVDDFLLFQYDNTNIRIPRTYCNKYHNHITIKLPYTFNATITSNNQLVNFTLIYKIPELTERELGQNTEKTLTLTSFDKRFIINIPSHSGDYIFDNEKGELTFEYDQRSNNNKDHIYTIDHIADGCTKLIF